MKTTILLILSLATFASAKGPTLPKRPIGTIIFEDDLASPCKVCTFSRLGPKVGARLK